MVPGVRVHGDKVVDQEVALDDLFREVPIPAKLGVPLVYKKMPGTGGDDSRIRNNVIVRFMGDPDDGIAPDEWQYGGNKGPAPPVVLARRDKLPFSRHDWDLVIDYINEWTEEMIEAEDEHAAVSQRLMSPAALQAYVRTHRDSHPAAFLPLQFPLGSTVVPSGLSAAELNDREGEVAQYGRDRVGVRFAERGMVALRPERLRLVREPPQLVEPVAKRQDTGDAKQKRDNRAKELQQQEALQIAQRFCECLIEDTFPEMGDEHLFGLGCNYRSRAQEVLAVWQGAVKDETLTPQALAQALVDGSMKELFEKTCRNLASSRNPNATYAMELIKNKFAALEWDTL